METADEGKMTYSPIKNPLLYFVPILILAVSAGSYFRAFDAQELQALDLRFAFRPPSGVSDNIAVIEMGDDTLKRLGDWPIGRNYHALLIRALSDAGARAIVFDVFFSEPREYDEDLESAMKDAGNVYLPFVFDIQSKKTKDCLTASGIIAGNLNELSLSAKGEGYINVPPDNDGKFRMAPLLIEYDGTKRPSMALRVASDYPGFPGIKGVPLDEYSNIVINFSGKWERAFHHYSYVDVLQSYMASDLGDVPILDMKAFKNKICIIGLTATGTVDLHPTPLEPLYPTMGVHAEVIDSIINKRFITRIGRWPNLAVLMFLAALQSLVALKMKPVAGFLMLVVESLFFCGAAILLFNLCGLWIDLFYPLAVLVAAYLFFTLCKYAAEWKRRLILESELDIAKKIQESFLPKSVPSIDGVEIAAGMVTAKQVGGDLYDFVEMGAGRIGIMIGDVSGKGVPASLFMALSAGAFRSSAESAPSPDKVLSLLNMKLLKESSSGLFLTSFYAILDVSGKELVYANGGHLPAILLHEGAKAEFLDTDGGTPLGLFEGNYPAARASIAKGDIIIFYTDGVTEAMNVRREMYGIERLLSVSGKNRMSSSEKLIEAIKKDVKKFEGRAGQHDDLTIIVVKII